MQRKITLLGGVALGAVLALGLGAQAQAKPMKHHHMVKAHAEGRDLGAEVEALRARLDAEEAARQQDQAAIASAQNEAAAARADAQAARAQVASQIETLPGVVAEDINKKMPKPNWSGSTTVGATVFADLSSINQSAIPGVPAVVGPPPIAAVPTVLNSKKGTGADIKRAYLTVDHKFNDIWSASLTADFAPNGIDSQPVSAPPGGGVQGAEVLKKAFIQAKVFGDDSLVLRGGTADMPWIPYVESVYGYRFVEKVITDTQKIGNSADTGVNASGSLAGGMFGYSVSAVDGAGYKNPVRSNNMDVEGRINVNVSGFIAAIGGYSGKLSKDYNNLTPQTQHSATREDALVAFKNTQFTLGLEYFNETNWNCVAVASCGAGHSDKGNGYSGFASFNITPQFSVFGRYDTSKPSQTLAPNEKVNYFNIGVNYEPVKVIDLALVYKHDEAKGMPANGSFTDANTTFANNYAGTGASGHYDEVGVFAQYKF